MEATFTITVDADRHFVRIVMGGFFSAADITRFAEARDDAHRQLRCRPNEHVTLVDIRNMKIQSQESVAGFQALLVNPAQASKRLAFVVAQSLARMQIKRAASSRQPAYFTDPEAAEQWLLEGDDADGA